MGPLGGLGITEAILILVVILLLFGAKRLPEIGSALGKGIREFKGSLREIEGEIKGDESRRTPPPSTQPREVPPPGRATGGEGGEGREGGAAGESGQGAQGGRSAQGGPGTEGGRSAQGGPGATEGPGAEPGGTAEGGGSDDGSGEADEGERRTLTTSD